MMTHPCTRQGRKLLATVGGDAAAPDGITLRVWDPAAVLAASSSAGPAAAAAAGSAGAPLAATTAQPLVTATPLASVRLFPAKQPPAGTVTAVAASDAAWPQLQIAVGLSSGGVQLMRGDADKGDICTHSRALQAHLCLRHLQSTCQSLSTAAHTRYTALDS
jgi:hypothetical protein